MFRTFPRIVGLCFLFAMIFVIAQSSFAQSSALKNDLRKSFSKVDVIHLNNSESLQQIESQNALSITTSEKTFQLSLTPRDLRSPRYRAENTTLKGMQTIESGAVTTFKGKVSGDENSQVRLTIEASKIEGFFTTGDEKYFIEPARRFSPLAAAGDFVVYRHANTLHK